MTLDLETIRQIVCVVGVVVTTGAAAYCDHAIWKIPNKLTLPAFVLGLIYQAAFNGLPGLQDAGLAFLAGFGVYFLLWMIGSGGGGDVKLMGAVCVWLGFKLTLYLMVVSTLFVVLGTFLVVVYRSLTRGFRKTQQDLLNKTDGAPARKHQDKLVTEAMIAGRRRRVMSFAVPVALAAWLVLAVDAVAIRDGQLGPKSASTATSAKPQEAGRAL